nr:MAG TPA: hypothetical protein [Caudoviricetes sp.]
MVLRGWSISICWINCRYSGLWLGFSDLDWHCRYSQR